MADVTNDELWDENMDAFFKDTLEQLTYQSLIERKHHRDGDHASLRGGKRQSPRHSSHESESAYGKNTSEHTRSVSKKASAMASSTQAAKDKMNRHSLMFGDASKDRTGGGSVNRINRAQEVTVANLHDGLNERSIDKLTTLRE